MRGIETERQGPRKRPEATHSRPPRRAPLQELIDIRLQKYPELHQKEFAALLGITRLHHTAIEYGRRVPSLDLALRWLALLAPEAKLEMFGPLPLVEARLRELRELQKLSPEFFAAA
jgi:DNA-binding XRE family transcriptional regulator